MQQHQGNQDDQCVEALPGLRSHQPEFPKNVLEVHAAPCLTNRLGKSLQRVLPKMACLFQFLNYNDLIAHKAWIETKAGTVLTSCHMGAPSPTEHLLQYISCRIARC